MKTRILGLSIGCALLLGFGGCALNQTNEPPKKQEVIIEKEPPKKVVKTKQKKQAKQTIKVGQDKATVQAEPIQNTQKTDTNESYKYTIILD
ncbi:MAG: hypothetical protein IJ211_03915 [Campylobacter sp.]|nr:hypothetical protein [Campylobacter sp.]